MRRKWRQRYTWFKALGEKMKRKRRKKRERYPWFKSHEDMV